MELEGSSQCSQEPATESYLECESHSFLSYFSETNINALYMCILQRLNSLLTQTYAIPATFIWTVEAHISKLFFVMFTLHFACKI